MLAADLTAVANRHGAEAPRLVHFIRGDLDWIVTKSLEKDRTRRYDTANGIAVDVQRFLRNDAIEARPPSNLYRFQKLVRRNRTVFLAAAAVVMALALGFGFSLYLYIREAGLRAEAERLRAEAEKGWALEKHLREVAPLGEKMTKAGYLLSRGDFAAAEELMAPLQPVIPAASAIYNVIGDHHAWRKEWPAAITNYLRSIKANPTNDLAYHLLAPALLQAGDVAAYRQHRQKILQTFSHTTDPTIAESLARACLLLPASPDEMEVIAGMADVAVASGPGADGWAKLAKGMVEYRQGHFTNATKWLDEASAQATGPALKLHSEIFRAMNQFQLGQTDAAQKTLAQCVAFEANNVLDRDGIGWNDRRVAYRFLDEAKSLIPKPAASASSQ
jgi:tetratricopeptide (TPR) repeat protein